MHPILVLLKKDFALLLRDRASIAITFVVPFVLIYLFGQIFHVNSTDQGPSGIPLAVVNQSTNPAAARLVDALKSEKAFKVVTQFSNPDGTTRALTEDDLRPLLRADRFRFSLVIPPDVVRADGFGIHLKTLSNPRNEIEAETVNGILQKALFTNVPQLLGQSLQARARAELGGERLDRFNDAMAGVIADAFGGDRERIRGRIASGAFAVPADHAQGSGASTAGDVLSRLIRIDNVQVAGANLKSPAATQLVGGWAIQFLLFALTASATALFREKEHGLFQRILSAPATRGDVLWSKFLYGICLGLIQLVVLFVAGHVLYGIEFAGQIVHLVIVCLFAAAACTSFGMLIAAVSPTPDSARGLSTFVILLMSAIGGAWFPVSFMPEFIQRFSRLTPVYWSQEGFSQVLWAHATLAELLPSIGWLSAMTALVMGVSVWRFRKGSLFD